jgi:N-acylneuraminate cytidylyltransferase/CMP-N,N'-diacetyllegionaminic acid synthase
VKRVCTICARGGSKGVPNKNLRSLAGRPLIAHSIEQARATRLFETVAVSSDHAEILRVALEAGADIAVERPAELATDAAPKVPAIRHCVGVAEERTRSRFDVVVDLDATSPLRTPDDIRAAVRELEAGDAQNLVSGTPARHSPYFNLVELDERGRVRLAKQAPGAVGRRQDSPACFDLNASIYVWRRDALMNGADSAIGPDTALYVMPQERSFDIDSEVDFRIVDMLMARGG